MGEVYFLDPQLQLLDSVNSVISVDKSTTDYRLIFVFFVPL